MTRNRSRIQTVAVLIAVIAIILGLVHAAVSFYWAAGGMTLLDTIGGQLEAYGRQRESIMIAVLWLVGLIEIVAAVLLFAAAAWPAADPRALRWHALLWDPWLRA